MREEEQGVLQLCSDGFIGVHTAYCEDYESNWLRITRKMVRECKIGDVFEPQKPTQQYTNLDVLKVVDKTESTITFHETLTCNLPNRETVQLIELIYSLKTFEKISETIING